MKYEIQYLEGYWVVFKNGIEQCGRSGGWLFTQIHQATNWISANFDRFGFEDSRGNAGGVP